MANPYSRDANGKLIFNEQVYQEERDRHRAFLTHMRILEAEDEAKRRILHEMIHGFKPEPPIPAQTDTWHEPDEWYDIFRGSLALQQFMAQSAARLAFKNDFPQLLKVLNFSPEQKAELKEIIDAS